ncbi:MAG: hypothetical protein AAGH87_03775 [Pseudomonadota bacterium]
MGVSLRNSLLAGLAAGSLLALSVAGGAQADGGMSAPGTPMPAAPSFGAPATPKGPGCCGLPSGPNIIMPGVNIAGPNVTVTSPHVSVSQGRVGLGNTQVFVGNSSGQTTFITGGGAFFAGPQGVPSTTLSNLNVTGGEQRVTETITEQVPVREEICVTPERIEPVIRPIQAVCLDDAGTPHPASQVTGERAIASDYTGELYRCMAGTSMQVTVGEMSGAQPSFDQAQSFACQKGEALVRRASGQLACAVQTPQRDCNERSLLRQYGPGLKLIQTSGSAQQCIPQIRTRMETRQRQVERVRPAPPAGPIVLDGGVGQTVF